MPYESLFCKGSRLSIFGLCGLCANEKRRCPCCNAMPPRMTKESRRRRLAKAEVSDRTLVNFLQSDLRRLFKNRLRTVK